MQTEQECVGIWRDLPVGAYERTVDLTWPTYGISGGAARMVEVRLLAWDPLYWVAGRPPWFAVAGDAADPKVVVYLVAGPEVIEGGAELVAGLTSEVGQVIDEHLPEVFQGIYARREGQGRVPSLLPLHPGGRPGTASPVVGPAQEWVPTSRRSIEDAVQSRFGAVRMDRRAVRLTPASMVSSTCPGCANGVLGYPEETEAALASLCPEHSRMVSVETRNRTERAQRSNPMAWDAARTAGERQSLPHLPAALSSLLTAAAARAWPGGSLAEQAVTVRRGLTVVDAEQATAAVALWPRTALRWLRALPSELRRAGEEQLADEVGALVAERLPAPTATAPVGGRAGRNEPCSCGSGRKYKYCHGQQERVGAR